VLKSSEQVSTLFNNVHRMFSVDDGEADDYDICSFLWTCQLVLSVKMKKKSKHPSSGLFV